MKTVKTITITATIIFVLFFAALINRSLASKPQNAVVHGDGFAVLELFTSEGCSSCPPADELLARLQQEAGNKPIYILAYHVDYWNRLGWKDIFSQAEFSKRQYQYSRQLGAQVYTPQLIINGKAEFVGSDETAIRREIKDALDSKRAATALTLHVLLHGGKFNISYQAKESLPTDQLLIAIVQKKAVSMVTGGENDGHTLQYVQIVRNLYYAGLTTAKQGEQQISMPAGFNSNDWEIIGLLQDQQTGIIRSATRAIFDSVPNL
jgi:hypothetical protein